MSKLGESEYFIFVDDLLLMLDFGLKFLPLTFLDFFVYHLKKFLRNWSNK